MANGTVVTRKGLQLIAKLVASETALTFTRVAIGTGKVPGGYDPGSMTGLNEYKMDGSIASHSASGDEASVVMQISSIGVETGFTITEAGLFATDPDEGEILYAYLDMSADPQYMYPENNAISKFIELTLVVKIGEVQSVTAVINPGSLITEEKFEAEKAETVHKSDIINSFSDTAGDHETVMGTVMGYQHDRDIKWLKGYAVTKEMISNQNVESADLVPSAYLLYQLNKTLLKKCEDLLAKYNALNSDLNAKTPTLQERYLTADTQTLSSNSTTTLWDSEVTIPFDCIMIGNWKVLCKSSDANASFYYMVKNAYVQGREQWDGTVQTDNTINIFVMNKFTKGTTLSVSVQGNCSIRGNNISLTRYNFTFIPL